MISRIRIEAFGATATEVENWLRALATRINHDFELDASFGEQVIQRDVGEPEGCRFAFEGRLILHPNIADDARQRGALIAAANNIHYWTPETGLTVAGTNG